MRHRLVDPTPRSVRDAELLLLDPELSAVVDDLSAHLRGEGREPRLWGYPDDVVEAIHRLAHRKNKDPFDEREFVKKMKETRPLAVQPRITDPALDLYYALAQPELVEDFWPSWNPRTGSRGRPPGYSGKAFLIAASALGHSAHFNANYQQLRADRRLRAVFDWVEQTAAASAGMRPESFAMKSYPRMLGQMHLLSERLPPSWLIEKNIQIVKEIHRLLGVETARLAIDATLWRAWTEQVAERGPEREAQITRVARNAKPKKLEGRHGQPSRFIRGYQLVALVDLTTGLPLVWTLWRADRDEVKALKELLFRLFHLWPDLRVDAIVADAAWDEKWAAEWCLVNYGLHLIAQRHPSYLATEHPLTEFQSEGISKFLGDGRAVCRRHGVFMIRDGYQSASRRREDYSLLEPEEPAKPRDFRLRYRCPTDPACGRPGLRMDRHWTALSYYPHTLAVGRPDLHAFRLAMFARRNACEALFSALQVGHKLGLNGAERTRTAKEPTVKALLSLAMVMRSARLLASLRIEQGDFLAEPPPDLALTLGLY